MDRISLLPNDFILHILSLLPTKDVLSTSVLSKRWRNLWKLVPKLEYIDCDKNADQGKFVRFVDRSLLLSTAPVLESLHFKLDKQCSEVDDVFWVETAVEQGLRELNFDYHYMINEPMRLPQSLFTCGTLMVLKLKNVSLVNVQFPVCFRLLKRLHLEYVNFLDDESPKKLLSSCPVLEVFDLDRAENNNVETFSVMVPTLQRFTYAALSDSELVMNTPSLKFFKTFDHSCEYMIEYMPEIVEAHVQIHGGTIVSRGPIYHWNEPRSVPETLSFVLETFEWRNYRGWKIEREIATFILKHARRLKIATFSPADPTEVRMELRTTLGMKYRMLMDLARLCFVNISFCIKRSMCNYRRMIELN